MRHHLHWLLYVLALLLAGCAHAPPERGTPAVVLVSIDGLPASVVGSGRMPVLDAIAARGVRADWMTPSYPTLTFPNHYTLVTGLRPDHHGIVHNDMRDAALGRFVSKQASARDGRWWGGEPIWNTLQRQGGIAATMFWPGSEADIGGTHPRFHRTFDRALTIDARVDQVLAWLGLPASQRPQLVTLYFEHYDVAAHATSTWSPQALAAMQRIDGALARLQRGLSADTNLIVLSDHGMADVRGVDADFLDDAIGVDAFELEWWGQLAGVHPAPGRRAEVERALLGRKAHHQCWTKDALPSQWHYGRHPRIPPIVCQADVGWRVLTRELAARQAALKGEHGYAPQTEAMRGMFIAAGPSFRSGAMLPAFDNVDVYPLLARLLRVTPAPNDGNPRTFDAVLMPGQ